MSITDYIRKFLDWWVACLLSLIPVAWRDKIIQFPDRLYIEISDLEITLKLYNGNSNELIDSKAVNRGDVLEMAGVNPWLAQYKRDQMEVTVLVQKQHILQKSLTLPLAGERNLQEIIGFEMDRQTPFTLEQVYYDTRITARDAEQDKISVDLFVATRDYLDKLLAELQAWTIHIATVSYRDGDEVVAVNLLPPTVRATITNKPEPLTLLAVTGALVLFIGALYLPIWHQQNTLDELNRELTEVRNQAKAIQPLLTEREAILSRTGFLAEQRHGRIPVIKILAELTNILPDDTFLERLTVRDGEVQINGESDNATSIIELVEKSDYFENAQPRSPVTKNPATNMEKFHVAATLTRQPAS